MNVQDIDQNNDFHHWKAEYIPDMSDIEKLCIPDSLSRGHMIILATPVSRYQHKQAIPDFGFLRSHGLRDEGLQLRSMGFSKDISAEVGDIDIGQGRKTGTGRLYTGELQRSDEGRQVIYHFRFLGFKPENLPSLRYENILSLSESISHYARAEEAA